MEASERWLEPPVSLRKRLRVHERVVHRQRTEVLNASRRRHRVDLLRAIRWPHLDSGVDTHEQSECAKRRTVVCSGCDVVYSTNEEASTSRQSMAAERGARARARRGAGDQRRRQTTDGRLRHAHRRTFRGGLRACRSPPPPLSSLEAASGTFLFIAASASHFFPPSDRLDRPKSRRVY